MALFRDRVLLKLSDSARLAGLLLPADDTTGAHLWTMLAASYDLFRDPGRPGAKRHDEDPHPQIGAEPVSGISICGVIPETPRHIRWDIQPALPGRDHT